MMRDELLIHAFFAPLVGVRFLIAGSGDDSGTDADAALIALRLTEATPLAPPRQRAATGDTIPITSIPARAEPFSLLFTGPLDAPLAQGTYAMTPETATTATATAPLLIFIVPIAREQEGYIYQAIFG